MNELIGVDRRSDGSVVVVFRCRGWWSTWDETWVRTGTYGQWPVWACTETGAVSIAIPTMTSQANACEAAVAADRTEAMIHLEREMRRG